MNNKSILLILGLVGFGMYSQAQSALGNIPGKGVYMDVKAYGFIQEMNKEQSKVEGTGYLFDNWVKASLEIDDRYLREVIVNIDLFNDKILLKQNEKIFILIGRKLKGLSYEDESFRKRAIIRKVSQDHKFAYCELLVEGEKYNLLLHHYAKLQKSNYNKQLDIGEEASKIIRKNEYFVENVSNGDFFKVPKAKKKIAGLFSNPNDVLEYVKNNHLDLKSITGLVKLIDYLNSL